MQRDQIAQLSDDDANALFERLVKARFGTKRDFARYVGISRAGTVYDWKRPPLWALLFLSEWEDAQVNRDALSALARALDRTD